jgi:hypothetical protein
MMKHRLPFLAGLAALALAVAGCETANTGAKKTAADNTEYEYVTPLGSNIPVRVPKGSKATNVNSPTENMTGEQAANMIQRAGAVAPNSGR